MPLLRTSAALCSLCLGAVAVAQTERDLDSHEHGAAQLDVVVDGSQLLIDLESPWNNLVGFEHRPSTDEQHEAVDAAMASLEDPQALFAIEGGDCQVASVEVDAGAMGADGEMHAEGEDHHDEDEAHAEGEDHHEEDEAHAEGEDHHDEDEMHAEGEDHHDEDEMHAEGEDHDHEEGEVHSEASASYVFECADPGAVAAIAMPLFDLWTGFEEIAVQMAGPGGQSAASLTAEDSRLDLGPLM